MSRGPFVKFFIKFFAIILSLSVLGCSYKNENAQQTFINTEHLDRLYEEISVEGKKMGIIHIYSEYPDYKWIGDGDEGVACVDDAARAAIFYIKYSKQFNDSSANDKAQKLIEFVLHLQSENGFFYNFIFPNYTINKTHQNSKAEADWWSWRALWALTESYKFFKDENEELSVRIESAIKKTTSAIKLHFQSDRKKIDLNEFVRPSWLPYQYASDQAALIVISLCEYNTLFRDDSVINLINDFCEGILLMQEGDKANFPYYAFMSWENLWHAWGNSQSYSLLCAYEITDQKKYLNAALNEINHFYKFLLKNKFYNEFTIKKENGKIVLDTEKKFSQIAYGIRPMVYATLKAAELTGDEEYSLLAADIASWLLGNNPANVSMYSPKNGICYDGIISEKEINKNSGAESTIEALLTLQIIGNNSTALKKLNGIIKYEGKLQ